jgi:hypothetical protein
MGFCIGGLSFFASVVVESPADLCGFDKPFGGLDPGNATSRRLFTDGTLATVA